VALQRDNLDRSHRRRDNPDAGRGGRHRAVYRHQWSL